MRRFFKSQAMMRSRVVLVALFLAIPAVGLARAEAEPITFESLLREMLDRDAIARFPDPPYTCKQFSSYDRTSVSSDNRDTWFANNDFSQFLRVEEVTGRKEWVMADMDGPGAVVRIWSANPKGTLRVYLDGETTPVIEAPMQELLGGTWKVGEALVGPPLAQESSRGWNLYLPIPYAKHCKITCDSDGFYYQVNYRTYTAGAAVETFSTPLQHNGWLGAIHYVRNGMRKAAPDFERECRFDGPGSSEVVTIDAARLIGHGDAGVNGAIDRFTISEPECQDRDLALRQLVLAIDFDGERCVRVPLSDFFGSGVGVNPFQDLYREVLAQEKTWESPTDSVPSAQLPKLVVEAFMTSWWRMPFQRECRIHLEYVGTQPVKINWRAFARPWKWDDRSMHFHAAWRQQYPIHALGGRGTEDWNYVEIEGEGVYVGDNLAVMNPVPEWWGEGDEKIYVDGEAFPSHFGTGTEDYYGYAWCSPVPFQHPFHAQPRCDGNPKNNWGHTTVTRTRSLDAIPFTKSLKFDMEVWHWRECDVAYAATTYWYAKPGSTSNRLTDEAIASMAAEIRKPIPQPPPLPPPFKIVDAIECESMKIVDRSDGLNAVAQDMAGFARETWSGDAHLWVQARRPGDFIKLEIPTPAVPDIDPKWLAYRVTLYATKSWDYGIIRFLVNGQPAATMDLYSGERGRAVATGPIDLGTFKPIDGRLTLRAEVFGANPASEGNKSFFGLDGVRLEAVSNAPKR